MQKSKILYIIGDYGVGGKERQLAELIRGLINTEFSISFIVKNLNAYYVDEIKNGLDYFFVLNEKKFGVRALIKTYKKIKIINPDIIHSWATLATIHAIILAPFFKYKIIDGSIQDSKKPDHLTLFLKLLIKIFANRIIANSNAGLNCYRVPRRKSSFVHNGFDFSRLNNLQPVGMIKSQYNIGLKKVVGMVARIDFDKDHQTFVNAGLQVLRIRPDVSFLIVGDGKDKEKISSSIPISYKENFIFTGQQSDIESIVNCFDVAVLATFTEGIPNAVMEYMALEKPSVVTEGGGSAELVVEGVTGFLVRQGDTNQLSEKILFLLGNEDIAKAMGTEGKRRISEYFSFKNMINKFKIEYEEILK